MTIRRDRPPAMSQRRGMRPRSPSEALEPVRAPSRPRSGFDNARRRESGFIRFVSGVLTLCLAGMVLAAACIALVYHLYEKPGPLTVSSTVVIPKGEGRIEIAERLERRGIISNRWVFVAGHLAQSWFGDNKGKNFELKAGEYEFKKAASIREVAELIAEGRAVLYKVTVPEGLTSQQIVERLRSEEHLTGEITAIPPEGSLMPATYSFSKGMQRQEILQRMKAEQARAVENLWQKRAADLPIKSMEEAVILASIVEKETALAEERPQVASVFVNRLRKGMRLQSDPTIIYGIVGGQGSLGRPIKRSEIAEKTAYNTYRINGLPPGPICNPGRPALEATLNPATTPYLYFVADGTGGHAFSENLSDHNDAVADWRKIEKERRAEQKAEAEREKAAATAQNDVPNPPAEDATSEDTSAPENAASASVSYPTPVRKPRRP